MVSPKPVKSDNDEDRKRLQTEQMLRESHRFWHKGDIHSTGFPYCDPGILHSGTLGILLQRSPPCCRSQFCCGIALLGRNIF